MPEKYRRFFLKDREAKGLLAEITEKLDINLEHAFKTRINLEIIETEFAKIYIINNKPLIAKFGEDIFPTLVSLEAFPSIPKVVVDMGAIPHVCNGADVMAPGIVRVYGEIRKGGFVFVVDEKYGKPLAVGEVLYEMNDASRVKKGVVVRNLHFVGDKLWNFIKEK